MPLGSKTRDHHAGAAGGGGGGGSKTRDGALRMRTHGSLDLFPWQGLGRVNLLPHFPRSLWDGSRRDMHVEIVGSIVTANLGSCSNQEFPLG